MRNQRGQFTIEAILLITLLFGVMLAISKAAKSGEWMKNMVEGPWAHVQGMIEDGVWEPVSRSKIKNPHKKDRHGSYKGDPL